MALYDLIVEAKFQPQIRLLVGDGLLSSRLERIRPDVIACNPPYRKLSKSEAELYRENYLPVIDGQPNLYGLFSYRAAQLVKPGGLVGLLTPTSFLSGSTFSSLRRHLATCTNVLQIDMLTSRTRMFIDVEQETAITTLRRRGRSKCEEPGETDIYIRNRAGKYTSPGTLRVPPTGSGWAVPRTKSDTKILRQATANGYPIEHYGFETRVGNLVAYRDQRRRFSSKPKLPVKNVVPLVWATNISEGKLAHGRQRHGNRPWNYVQVDSLASPGTIKQPAVVLQRLTSSDQARRLVAASVPDKWMSEHGGFVCENHVIVLAQSESALMSSREMAKLLNTTVVDRLFRAISTGSNVAVAELKELRLPDPEFLRRRLDAGDSMEQAARKAYRISRSPRKS